MAGQDFCLRAVSSGARGQRSPWRWAGDTFVVAMDITNTTTLKSINVPRKLSMKESGGIMLHALCSAPSTNITTQAKKAQAMVGTPTIINNTKSLPFMLAKHFLSLLDESSSLIL
jgi:hypothetical protein